VLDTLATDPPSAAATVSADTDVGTLMLHAHDTVMTPMIRETGRWEPSEGAWLRAVLRAGDTVVDCGANVGYFTVLASRCVGPAGLVVALEPEAENLRLLRSNLWANRCDNVWVLPAAAADQRGLLALRRNAVNTGDHQVHESAGPDDVLVPSLTLDDLLEHHQVHAAKIDAQGFDHLVMAGFAQTLARSPEAQVLVEFWLDGIQGRGARPEDVITGYRQLGRPIGILAEDGAVNQASDDQIIAAADCWEGRWVNLVLGPAV
jgi:FkbM family methyltransferase